MIVEFKTAWKNYMTGDVAGIEDAKLAQMLLEKNIAKRWDGQPKKSDPPPAPKLHPARALVAFGSYMRDEIAGFTQDFIDANPRLLAKLTEDEVKALRGPPKNKAIAGAPASK